MRVYHDFFWVPGSRSTFPDTDPTGSGSETLVYFIAVVFSVLDRGHSGDAAQQEHEVFHQEDDRRRVHQVSQACVKLLQAQLYNENLNRVTSA